MATTQDGRLLSISTPLGKDFLLLKRMKATEGLSELFRLDVELLHEETSEGFEATPVDVQRILGQTVSIAITQRDGNTRAFNGIVSRFSQGTRDNRFSYYYATIVPHVWILTQNVQSRIFQHVTVPDILKKVFEGFEMIYEIQGAFQKRNYCVQYRESDFAFAARLMEEEGIYYYFEHAGGTHKMIIANTPQSHRACPGKSSIPCFIDVTRGQEDWVSSIATWRQDYQLQSGKVTLWDHNFELPHKHLEVEKPSRFNVGGNQELEIYEFPAGYARKYDGIDRTGGERPADLQHIFEDNQKTAQIRMEELDSQYQTANGIADCASMTAGYRFALFNHPTRKLNANYVLTSLAHEAEQSPNYVANEEIGGAYGNSFQCIAHGAGTSPYRPPQKTPKPSIQGSQTATVVGPPGEEIFTDKYGRVKVQFNWDRESKFDPDSSCWIRVAKDLAGKKWGSMYIPRIGQEVIVDFMEGDPDQPIITGAVYNPETMPHYELPKYKTLTYIKTRTSPDDGKGFNELRFEDKQDKEQVFIRSQKRMDVRVRGSYYKTVGGNRQEVIGVRADNQPGGNLAITVGGNYDLHVKADMFVGIDGKLNHTVKGDEIKNVQGNYARVVTGKSELNAREIILEAMSKISLKVGGSFITIDLSGVTISGPMVKINSGGAGTPTSTQTIDDPLDAETADTGEPGYLERPRTGGGRRGRNRRTLTGQHAPPFTTKTLPNGDIQVGNHIVIKKDPNDPAFQDKVLRDMTTMSNHPTGMNTLNGLNNSNYDTTIKRTTGGNGTVYDNVNDAAAKGKPDMNGNPGTGKGTGNTIKYNPDDPVKNAKRPPDVGLHHEMVHGVHGAQGTDDNSPDAANPNNPTVEETETINKDNDYRDERGVHKRRDHSSL
ncbi:MAG TPA: type VI secretion system tip protein TssI/VgrG [Pyrinomonadaceae bacterium]